MSRKNLFRRILLAFIILILLSLAWATITGAIAQIPRSNTIGRQIETGLQFGCGVFSILTVITCFRWCNWAEPIRVVWIVSLVSVAGLSSLVWGPPMPLIAIVLSALALLLALAIVWTLRYLAGEELHS